MMLGIGNIVLSVLRPFGIRLGRVENRTFGYSFESEAQNRIARVRANTMLSYECLVTLFQQARYCELNDIPGSYVECGVWKGGAAALMAQANLDYGKDRRPIHMFDAFDDICEPDPAIDGERAVREAVEKTGVDREELSGRLKPLAGVYSDRGGAGTVAEVAALMREVVGYDESCLNYHVGWFQNTLPEVETGDIAILRLDGDWYASTKVCLEHLYDRVVTGGFVIIDDYGAYEGCRMAVDEFIEDRGIKAYLNHVNVDCRYWIKP